MHFLEGQAKCIVNKTHVLIFTFWQKEGGVHPEPKYPSLLCIRKTKNELLETAFTQHNRKVFWIERWTYSKYLLTFYIVFCALRCNYAAKTCWREQTKYWNWVKGDRVLRQNFDRRFWVKFFRLLFPKIPNNAKNLSALTDGSHLVI